MGVSEGDVFRVLEQSSGYRLELECKKMVPYFLNKVNLFKKMRQEIVADVIRHCEYERKKKDDVLIKQGDSGDRLYIILRGSVSVYVIHDQKDNPADVLKQVNAACNGPDFDRSELGQYVWTGGEGKCFGEVALLKEDCIRTATVVADGDTDLVIIDRNLYNRSVKDVLEMEYNLKTKFVEENTLFKTWPIKQKKLLVVALKKESAKYGSYLLRQGSIADHMYFLLSGEIEITCDQSQFKRQYPELWREMETLLPGLLPRRHSETPHERLKRKKLQRKVLQMCLLGSNESVGVYK
ncbi:cAMP-dependent protein kinase type II-alpha regulatory subunit-like isoform X2 [Ruditapes philippinarum]|uniref:cAMP-dependent protein kinase type II-alpha regulatory subunit-like isoform X2 n=1 Tax=Ruditapes philippinarum TaxID=129788 RepID=UPI00295BEC11|nr:cAMP-dependent protein kinase type II-alpha regulatory subunit-like isoform X2 [Ruditapes philippinarum]